MLRVAQASCVTLAAPADPGTLTQSSAPSGSAASIATPTPSATSPQAGGTAGPAHTLPASERRQRAPPYDGKQTHCPEADWHCPEALPDGGSTHLPLSFVMDGGFTAGSRLVASAIRA